MSFIERHDLWDNAQAAAAHEMERTISAAGLETIRVAFADQHGLLRGKTIVAREALKAMHAGVRMVGTILLKDTSNRTTYPVFTPGAGFGAREFEGAADLVLVPDPTTFRVLPWVDKTGWVLCGAYFLDGRGAPFDTRASLRHALARLAESGYDYVAGLEIEMHMYRLSERRPAVPDGGWPPAPPEVEPITSGFQLLNEQRFDQFAPALDLIRRNVIALGLPLRSVEVEFGPSQCEFVFDPGTGVEPADNMVLFRNAVKQIARRHGYHATFMCRPCFSSVMSSGWHLHQSLRDRHSGRNAFTPDERAGLTDSAACSLSRTGIHFLGGLLANAAGYTVFATPTVNGYRRYHQVNSLAPDRVVWGRDNRGAMIRVIGAPGDPASRIENRLGEPAANPYLYMASQIYAGIDGLDRQLDPGPCSDAPYQSDAERIPTSLEHAVKALRASAVMRAGFGDALVEYYAHIKEFELARFNAEVTAWEQREYFDLF